MQQRTKLLEKFSFTERQALLTILALYFLGTMALVAMELVAPAHNTAILLSTGLAGTILFGGAWFLYYWYEWEPVRYFAATTAILLVALSLPEPFISSYAPMVLIIPLVLSLIVGGSRSMILNAVLLIVILLVRAGGRGVYAYPATLTIYGMIVGGLLVKRLIDVSEQKRAEEVLQASEARYRLLFEENPLPLLVYDTGSLRILAVNDAAVIQYGYARDEFLQMTILEILPPEEMPRLEAVLNGRPRPCQERSGPWKQRNKDGTLFDVEVVSNETSFQGRPARLVLVNNITEQLQAKAALAASEQRFRGLIENSADGITVLDSQGRVTYVSPSIERMLGYAPEEAIGQRAMHFVHREDRVRLLQHVARLNRDGEGHQVLEYRFKHKDGSWRCLESTLAHQADAGTGRGIVFNYRDVTARRQADRELETLYGQLRNLFDNLDEVFFSLDTVHGAFLQMSPACERVFGWSASAFMENPQLWRQIMHPDDLHIADASTPRLYAGESMLQEYRLHHANGELRWVETKLKPTLDQQGRLIRVDGIVSDITGRKQAESDLQASESRYRLATRATNDVIWEWNAVTDQLTWAEIAQIVFGYSREEIGTDTGWWDEHIHPEDRPRVTAGLMKLINGRETVWSDEYRFLLKGGSYAIFSDRGYVEREADGQAIRMIGAISDITLRMQAEEHIKYQARLLENVSDAIIATDMAGRITSWNPAAEEIYGWRSGEVLGRLVDDVLQAGFQEQTTVEQQYQQLLQQGLWRGEVTQRRRDGTRITILAAVSLVRDRFNAPVGMVANNCDISERRQAEEQLRILNLELEKRVAERTMELHRSNAELEHASRAKDEFLANMSHELRTPLNSILGLSETLLEQRRGTLDEYQQRSLRIIEASGAHLLELINDILDLSKIEAGKFDCYPETVRVEDLMQSSLAFVKSQALKKSIRMSYEADPQVSTILADPRRLKQILVNLLTNAVKFTPEGGRVMLQVCASAGENLIRFSVSDTGIGIAARDLARLFRPFEQVDSQLNRQYEGTGLGLALVQKLTDLHGGSVHVQSEVGKGSCFTINLPWERELLPVENSASELQQPAREPSRPAKKNARPIRILLAEDHVANILTIGEYLESHGYQVIVAHDGGEALEKAQEADPDLILVDIQMPVIDGLQVTSRLRTQARFTRTPIIALTALAMPGDRERCLLAGANEYMSKPVSLQGLVRTIRQFTSQK
jgi:PAS domain S-box-containing protein